MQQDAGRGRQGRQWIGETGNFFGSTLVALAPGDPSPPSLSLVAGLALIEAVDVAVPDQALMLKWPNDLMLGTSKLAGILLERSGNRVVAGFGVNLASAPRLPDRDTAALNGALLPQEFGPLLAGSFARMLNVWRRTGQSTFAGAWLARAHPIGTKLNVHSGADQTLSGQFDGIEPDGALRLRRGGAVEIIRAGDVEL
jgi:BirA family biotin operon repressor/biotin-[acetyl-CoA-carboxylase] ligase